MSRRLGYWLGYHGGGWPPSFRRWAEDPEPYGNRLINRLLFVGIVGLLLWAGVR